MSGGAMRLNHLQYGWTARKVAGMNGLPGRRGGAGASVRLSWAGRLGLLAVPVFGGALFVAVRRVLPAPPWAALPSAGLWPLAAELGVFGGVLALVVAVAPVHRERNGRNSSVTSPE
jgi:hypothetical protein